MVFREGSIHHLPVAHPNDALVCLPNGTWAPSVTGTPMQKLCGAERDDPDLA